MLNIIGKTFWLGSIDISEETLGMMYCNDLGATFGYGLFDYFADELGCPYGKIKSGSNGVLPVVFLKSGILLVEGSGMKNDPWKILPPEGENVKHNDKETTNLSIKHVGKQLLAINQQLRTNALKNNKPTKRQKRTLRKLEKINEYLKKVLDSM